MKNFFRKNRGLALLEIMLVIVIMAILAAVIFPRRARAQNTPVLYQPNVYRVLTNWTGVVVTNGTTLYQPATNEPVTVRQDHGQGFLLMVQSTAGDTSPITVNFDFTTDGISTNWTTNNTWLTWKINLNGTNIVTAFTNFGRDQVNNVRQLYPDNITGASTNKARILLLEESHGNQ